MARVPLILLLHATACAGSWCFSRTSRTRLTLMKHQWIGGRWLKSPCDKISVINPATEETIAQVARGTTEDANLAVAAARAAFRSWRWVPGGEKAAMLHAAARAIRGWERELAPLMTKEDGKPLW